MCLLAELVVFGAQRQGLLSRRRVVETHHLSTTLRPKRWKTREGFSHHPQVASPLLNRVSRRRSLATSGSTHPSQQEGTQNPPVPATATRKRRTPKPANHKDCDCFFVVVRWNKRRTFQRRQRAFHKAARKYPELETGKGWEEIPGKK